MKGLTLQTKAIELSLDGCVAFAGCVFQPASIEDRHVAVAIVNESGLLQRSRDNGDGRAGGAKHHRQELMAQLKFVVADPIMRHQ